jgi:hypothetical protein
MRHSRWWGWGRCIGAGCHLHLKGEWVPTQLMEQGAAGKYMLYDFRLIVGVNSRMGLLAPFTCCLACAGPAHQGHGAAAQVGQACASADRYSRPQQAQGELKPFWFARSGHQDDRAWLVSESCCGAKGNQCLPCGCQHARMLGQRSPHHSQLLAWPTALRNAAALQEIFQQLAALVPAANLKMKHFGDRYCTVS